MTPEQISEIRRETLAALIETWNTFDEYSHTYYWSSMSDDFIRDRHKICLRAYAIYQHHVERVAIDADHSIITPFKSDGIEDWRATTNAWSNTNPPPGWVNAVVSERVYLRYWTIALAVLLTDADATISLTKATLEVQELRASTCRRVHDAWMSYDRAHHCKPMTGQLLSSQAQTFAATQQQLSRLALEKVMLIYLQHVFALPDDAHPMLEPWKDDFVGFPCETMGILKKWTDTLVRSLMTKPLGSYALRCCSNDSISEVG